MKFDSNRIQFDICVFLPVFHVHVFVNVIIFKIFGSVREVYIQLLQFVNEAIKYNDLYNLQIQAPFIIDK